MGLFNWFKKKQVEAETPNLLQEMDLESFTPLTKEDEELWRGIQSPTKKIKIKAILSNRVLTVFLPGGDVITNTDANRELLQKVQGASTEAEIRTLMLDESNITDTQMKRIESLLNDREIVEAIPEIVGTGEFTERSGSLYLNGIDISIPKLLAKEIIKAGKNDTDEYYESLKNFWCWCVLNPDPIAREDLFGFLERGDFKITRNGFFLGYRNVVEKGKKTGNPKLAAFISDKYLNIKTKQKKSPKNYELYMGEEGYPVLIPHGKDTSNYDSEDYVGNLADLYNNLSTLEDNEYTDDYTHTMSIKIGVPVKMKRGACDSNPNSDCSRGLHIKNKYYGNGSGNISILVAVNPMNVVAVPNHNANKMRVCEYMPLGVIQGEWKDWLEDTDSLSIEEEYAVDESQNLLQLAKEARRTENENNRIVPEVLVNQVINTLDIGAAISARVKEV